MPQLENKKFVLLVVLDGWGIAPDGVGNAITQAKTPNIRKLQASFPHTQLIASGDSVGLPKGEVGNTETGHLNLGAGQIVYQDLARINMSIADGSFFKSEALLNAAEHVRKNNSSLHYMGLLGAGGVHSNSEHLYALIRFAREQNISNLFIHIFTDGRDSPPQAALGYIHALEEVCKKEGVGQIASVMGRYWAMDRDQRWERTAKAYFCLTNGVGNKALSAKDAINSAYASSVTDEFVEPTLITKEDGNPISLIAKNDAVVFFNFRIDRPRQLTRAFMLPGFSAVRDWDFDPHAIDYEKKHKVAPVLKPIFERGELIENLFFVTMTEYEKTLSKANVHVAVPPEIVELPLGRVISTNSLKQLRVSESEKERFVTYYFNGLREGAFDGEDRLIVPSPNVATYDLEPQMSALQMTEQLLIYLRRDSYSFVLINFANADMVGHTGNIQAAIKAVETIDECIGKLSNFVLAYGGTMIITADHGNAEEMVNAQTGGVDTEHSRFPVPFIAVSKNYLAHPQMLSTGILADVAPTVLKLLGLEVPSSMMGRNLLEDLRF